MPSTINAQTTPFAAVVTTADNTGNLALQTANVTALTIDINQNATFANVVTASSFVGPSNASSITGIVAVANGGTGSNSATFSGANITSLNASNISSGTIATARLATGTANSTTYLRGDQTWATVTQTRISGGTTGLTPNTLTGGDVTLAGTLAVANGGTGATTLTANNVLLGNGTSALQAVAPGSNGNVLTSNGTTWTSSAPPAGGVTSLNGQTGAITNTGTNTIGSYISAGFQDGVNVGNINYGTTIAGSNINRYISSYYDTDPNAYEILQNQSVSLSGTWRSMGSTVKVSTGSTPRVLTLWVRIS